MDVGRSFSYQFEDEHWTSKLGLGAVISLVPILNFALSGYIVEVMRNVANNFARPLPGWDDLGKKFSEGLILFAAGLVYALPLILVVCLPLGMLFFSRLFSNNGNLEDLGRSIAGAGGMLFYCLLCLFILYMVVLSFIYPAILVMFSRTGTFAACFNFKEAVAMISRNSGSFFTAWIVSFGAGIGIGLIVGFINAFVSWIPCIGWIIALVLGPASGIYFVTVHAHLFGQFAANAFGAKTEQNPLVLSS
jgi:hypothetical protein